MKPRNDRALVLSAFCLELEGYRRTDEGRIRDANDFLRFFFPLEGGGRKDAIFVHIPRQIRGPIISGWGVRGKQSALRDDDERVRSVVEDALAAEDLDAARFEAGLDARTVIDWAPLDEWWRFWRGATLPPHATRKALATARALRIFDDTWFLETVASRGGRLKGTDAVAENLTKDQIAGWVRAVHASGTASPDGLVAAITWETILAKTAPEALLMTLDALAARENLVNDGKSPPSGDKTSVPPPP